MHFFNFHCFIKVDGDGFKDFNFFWDWDGVGVIENNGL
jgi:hypothetical protein